MSGGVSLDSALSQLFCSFKLDMEPGNFHRVLASLGFRNRATRTFHLDELALDRGMECDVMV